MENELEMTVGIECHVQLATASKLFSPADNDERDKQPNSVVNEIDFGLPGVLPVLNREAVVLAVRAAKALNAEVNRVSRFDRKHYFYPDLPKGYQISQLYQPLILAGKVVVPLPDGTSVDVRINHAHLEEDAGKLTHFDDYSLVDLNRAGTPLIEIVSEPDMHSAEQAKAYATELYRLMTYAGITRGDLYHGNMRFDVNVSVAPKGSATLGNRTEIKNLNSFRSVERACSYEFDRQSDLLRQGGRVIQETRGWDENRQVTFSQRSKENAPDYRYMPDPDIPPIVLSDMEIVAIQNEMPMLPQDHRLKWRNLNLDRSVIDALLASRASAEMVSAILDQAGNETARMAAHWLASALGHTDGSAAASIDTTPAQLIELAAMVMSGELSQTAAKQVFLKLSGSALSARALAEAMNLLQVSDESSIEATVTAVIEDPASQKSIEDVRSGKEKAVGYLVGQVMKLSGGKANPALVQKILRQKLGL